jgi:hypothetical protein
MFIKRKRAMRKIPWMAGGVREDLEDPLVYVAFAGFIYWTMICAFSYALMGGWGGTRSFSADFILLCSVGYAIYGLLLGLEYKFFGRVRFLPWLDGKKPVRDIFLLLLFTSFPVAGYFSSPLYQ